MKLHRPRPVLLSLLALAPPARAAARKAAGWVRLGLVRDFRLCKMLFLQVALLLAGVCLVSGQTADDGFTPSLDDVVYAFAVQHDG